MVQCAQHADNGHPEGLFCQQCLLCCTQAASDPNLESGFDERTTFLKQVLVTTHPCADAVQVTTYLILDGDLEGRDGNVWYDDRLNTRDVAWICDHGANIVCRIALHNVF